MTLLPDDTRPRSRPPKSNKSSQRGFYVLLWLLLIVLAVSLVSIVTVLLYFPAVIGYERSVDLTQTSIVIAGTANALEDTANALDITAQVNAQSGFDNQSTAAALQNQIALLEGRETQSARDIAATSTGIAVANARQATQSALDYQGTQTAFERQATQVELDFQGTQAALSQNATAVALGFATEAPSPELQQLDATPSPDPLFNESFTTGLDTGLWTYSDISDWSLNVNGGLIAVGQRAWLLTEREDFQTYTIETVILPAVGQPGFYYVLLNTGVDHGLGVEIYHDGERVTTTGLYRVNRTQIDTEGLLSNQNLSLVQTVQTTFPPTTRITVQTQVSTERIVVFVDGTATLDVALDAPPPSGAIGVYIPLNAGIERINVSA